MKALRALFPYNNITRKGPAGLIRLHLSTKTAHTQSPILFTESSLYHKHSLGDSKWLKHSTTKHRSFPIAGTEGKWPPIRLQQEVKIQLLTIGDEFISGPTRIVVVLTSGQHITQSFAQECEQLQKQADTRTVTILDLHSRSGLLDSVAFKPLQTLIVKQLSIVQTKQITRIPSHKWLLYAPPFDLLARARRDYPRNDTIGDYLREVTQNTTSVGYSKEDLDDFIASAFLIDAYPPQIHGFSPTMVFTALYEKQCLSIWDNELKSRITGVSSRFVYHFTQLSAGGLRSTTTYFICLCRPPEHILPCTHAIYDTCIVIFGKPSPLREYHFVIAQYPICDETSDVTVRQLPPTKNPVILSLDGGGVRGLIQLGLLQALERRIGIPIGSLLDLYIRTSVGALSAIDIILNQSSVAQCFNTFPDLARNIFRRSSKSPVPRYIRLSQIFKAAVGPSRYMFDIATASPTGYRITIVASHTSNGTAYILANYRGTSPRTTNTAYQFLAPHHNRENPSLYDAYFQTKHLPGFSLLQDSGVHANNPLGITLRESGIIWPMAKRHDLLLSIGTGFSSSTPSDSTGFLSRIREGTLPRLFRAIMSSPSMDGKQGFLEALNYLPHISAPDILRLDQAIDGTLPELDDIYSLEAMSNLDFKVPAELIRTILASAMFFFELDKTPIPGNSSFHCQGSVLYSRLNPAEILQRVLIEFPGARFQCGQDLDLGSIDLVDIYQFCGYFRKHIDFRVTSLNERVSIEIANNTFRERIGGFPKSAQEFLNEQQAYALFRRADHQHLEWPPRRSYYCYRGSKRLVHFLEPTLGQKKRRL
ncbi:Acyl transferase/acyl hydrolase/lysophospholipase [Penicillium roqueforti FM164]|uniref:Acyl transferase/acyl hydrolase/lysophospholipase n=1 Tax=Penicillium roqueforti (strain FM164) TaxID=1365484 RepID=W6QNP6_PENRF|nr:Acyl transferase/acyl hydrolase/lysophospholipase [Penicillium roqueforti FM164]